MIDRKLTILAVSDLHYTGLARQTAQPPQMRGELAKTLLKKVFVRLKHMGVRPDLTLVLGDLLENGNDRNARLDLLAINSELLRSEIPFLALPGNHDGNQQSFGEIFNITEDLQVYGGYGLILYSDKYKDTYDCSRAETDIMRTQTIAKDNPGLPLIAVQHPPIYPPIDSHYPYRPANSAEIIDSFKKAGVILSLSGHYHKGQKPRTHEGVLYHSVPALCEAPFRFSLIRLEGANIEVEDLNLITQLPNIIDVHSHSEFAYCGTTVDAASCIALSQALGVSSLCITEHSFQLYFEKRCAMGFRWQSDAAVVKNAWAQPERGRMLTFRKFAEKIRSPFVKVGLEVDLYDNGKLLIAPEDMDAGWDILIGSIHYVLGFVPGKTSQKEAESLFMRDVEIMVAHDIDVMAHPFRFFERNRLTRPKHLYPVVAGLLADCGIAAEVNYHVNQPDVEFIRACHEQGVSIALASDAHDLAESGEFWPHVNLLKQAGITPRMYPEALFRLKKQAYSAPLT
ncbi:MAG: metallophosphoesterase [Kiritimatiellae bacterium]|nr:metallophosphoesterase [Kiritimatiellia bacterium]